MLEESELVKAGIDVKKGLLYTDGDMEVYENFLKVFYQDETYRLLKKCIEKKDAENSYLHTCSLCGASSYLGMTSLHKSLLELLEELRNGTFEKTDVMIQEVEMKYQIVMDILKKALHL